MAGNEPILTERRFYTYKEAESIDKQMQMQTTGISKPQSKWVDLKTGARAYFNHTNYANRKQR